MDDEIKKLNKIIIKQIMEKIDKDYEDLPEKLFLIAVGNIFVIGSVKLTKDKNKFLEQLGKVWDYYSEDENKEIT